ncbi:hypothetical protein ABN584_20440 [Gloeocapsa sp. BRSZ]
MFTGFSCRQILKTVSVFCTEAAMSNIPVLFIRLIGAAKVAVARIDKLKGLAFFS